MARMDIEQINVTYPEAPDLHLRIRVGACRLKVSPDAGDAWVTGVYNHPSNAMPIKVDQQGGTVSITQQYDVPYLAGLFRGVPTLELRLGKARPYALTLETGASDSAFDLGGLPISRLIIKQGAGRAIFDFSTPNPQQMGLLDLEAGAAGIEMKHLANANFVEMNVRGGAASYRFDFGGQLEHGAGVRITTGMAAVEVDVPASTAAKIVSETPLGSLDVGDGFMKKEGAFWTEAALAGKTPVLNINATVSLGSIIIRIA